MSHESPQKSPFEFRWHQAHLPRLLCQGLLAASLVMLGSVTMVGASEAPEIDENHLQVGINPHPNAYQLRIQRSTDGTCLGLSHEGDALLCKPIPQAEGARIDAAMTPDGVNVAYSLDGEGWAELWFGVLSDVDSADRAIDTVNTAIDELGTFHFDPSGNRLVYSIVRGGADGTVEGVLTELYQMRTGELPERIYVAEGRYAVLGWTQANNLMLLGPDMAVATLEPRTSIFRAGVDLGAPEKGPRAALTQIHALPDRQLKANGASILEGQSSFPSSIAPNETKAVRIRVYNSNTTTWSAGTLHRLGAEYQGNNNQVTWSGFNCGGYMSSPTNGRAYLCWNVGYGGSYDFYFNITAPSNASGSTRFAMRMVQDGVQWFGESYTRWITVSNPSSCSNSGLATRNDRWKLEIWNNRYFSGSTVEQRYDFVGSGGFSRNWGSGKASNCTGNDNYAIRFSRQAYFPTSGNYTFTTTTDDGVRLWVDGVLIIDRWIDQAPTSYQHTRWINAGWHDLRMDYYENGGGAYAAVGWQTASSSFCPAGQYDMADYVLGDSPNGRAFSRMQHNGAQEEFGYIDGGTVGSLDRWFFIKNSSGDNWEEFGFDNTYVYRYRDTSWGVTCSNNPVTAYYGVIDNDRSSYARWSPRCVSVGQYWHSPQGSRVDAGYKNWGGNCSFDCTSQYEGATHQRMHVYAHHNSYTTIWGVTINDVLEVGGIDASGNPLGDHFWYSKQYGLVGFEGPNPADPPNPYRSGAYQVDASGHSAMNRVSLCGT